MMGLGAIGLVAGLLIWGGLVALAVWLVRALFPSAAQPPGLVASHSPSAREILDRRYARGEINQEEYDLMKASIFE